ncbi:heme exporter protein CcmD [Brevundimonas sp.]|uniref:heme exporter protein CcmD n=1 Tax=Brevundimonas sp. TaxID=1871086 RepID=UPI0025C4712C|nr:heme exporter protein CcmD [Brevundimonas sp.]
MMLDFDMGKYAAYVWPAWGISAVVLAALAARALLAARRWSAQLKRLENDPDRPQAAPGAAGQTK